MLRGGVAWLVLVLPACGDNGATGFADATQDGPRDSTADATLPPDALPSGPVTVTVNRRFWSLTDSYPSGNPLPGVPVVFVNPDGQRVEVLTDSSGRATAVIELGASASIVLTPAPVVDDLIVTYLELEPGDEVVFGAAKSPPTDVVTMNLDFDPISDTQVWMTGGCFSVLWPTTGDSSGTLDVTGYCADHPFDLAVFRFEPNGPGVLDFAVARNVIAQPGGTIQFSPWMPYSPRPIQVGGMVDPWGWDVLQLDVGAPLWPPSFSPEPQPGPTFAGLIHDLPIGDTVLRHTTGGPLADQWQAQLHRLDPTTSSVEIDMADRMLPWLSNVTFASFTRTIAWNESTVATDHADMVVADLLTEVDGRAATWWSIRAPRSGATEVRVPDLGPAYQHFTEGNARPHVRLEGYGGRAWSWLKGSLDEMSFSNPDPVLHVEVWSSAHGAAP